MKTFIIGFFSLALLATQSAWGQTKPEMPHGAFPKIGVPAVCNNTGGIMVIVLQRTGDVTAFACSMVSGKPIERKESVEAGMKLVKVGDLGVIKKYKQAKETDPCYEWTVDGESHFYCWEE